MEGGSSQWEATDESSGFYWLPDHHAFGHSIKSASTSAKRENKQANKQTQQK